MSLNLWMLATAIAFGFAHAFEVDHLTAVSNFVSQGKGRKASLWLGAKWAIGHAVTLTVFGSFLFVLKFSISEPLAMSLERLVGLSMLCLGLWSLKKLKRSDYIHSHSKTKHGRGSLFLGMLHGLAGTAAFAGQSVIALASSYSFVLLYTLAFSLGVCVAMALYALCFGIVMHYMELKSQRLQKTIRLATALWTAAVGATWALK